jgi:DNA-binding transcriptional MerR regulator
MRRPGPEGRGPGNERDDREFGPRPEELERFLDFTREHFPRVHEKLVQARSDDPQAFRQMLWRVGPPMMRLVRLARDNPKEAERLILLQKLEMQIHETRDQYRNAKTDDERNKIRTEMRGLIEQKFDARQERLKAEIEELRKRLDEQDKRKQQIIDDEIGKALERRGLHKHGRHKADSQPAE